MTSRSLCLKRLWAVTGADCLDGVAAPRSEGRPPSPHTPPQSLLSAAAFHVLRWAPRKALPRSLAGSGALFANQLCGFRRPEITSGLSTPSTLFRKLERLVVVSEMTPLEVLELAQTTAPAPTKVGRAAARGAGGLKTGAAVISAGNCSSASLQLLHIPFMWAKKELYQTESLYPLETLGW